MINKYSEYKQLDYKIFELFKKYLILVHGVSEETITEFELKMIQEYSKTNTG